MHVSMCVSFHHSSINHLCALSAGCIAATKLVWKAVILNGSEASGSLANGIGHLKCIARQCIKSFGGKPSNPPCLRACPLFIYAGAN